MADLNTINVYGELNARTFEGIIAKAEQISVKLPFLENNKDKAVLTDYLREMVRFKTAEYITEYVTNKDNNIPAMFISTTDGGNFKRGHVYYYGGLPGLYEDLTPETGGGGGEGTSDRPMLNIQTAFRPEYNVGEKINVSYSWISSANNTGYGRVYGIIDGKTILSRRELPSNAAIEGANKTWEIQGLPRGKHTIEMYVIDSGNIQSYPRFKVSILVGGLEVISDFNFENYYLANQELHIPYEILNSSEYQSKLFVTFDNDEPFEELNPKFITISAEKMTDKIHIIKIQARTFKINDEGEEEIVKESNILSENIISAKEGKVYVTAHSNSSQIGNDPYKCSIEEKQQAKFTINTIEIGGSQFTAKYYLIPCDSSFTQLDEAKKELIKELKVGLGQSSISYVFKAGTYILRAEVISKNSGAVGYCDFQCLINKSTLLTLDPIVDDSLKLWIDATGKTNNDNNKEEWLDKSGNNVPIYLHDFNYNTNGWVMNEDGTSKNYLLINSRSYVEIDLEPFYKEIENGLTVDIEFETRDVSNVNAKVISCYGGSIGFFANTDTARLGSSSSPKDISYSDKENSDGTITTIKTGPFEVNFRQSVKTHLTFCISKFNPRLNAKNVYPISLMTMYVNGVMSGLQALTGNDSFKTNKWQKIYLGCNPVEGKIDPSLGPTEFENFGEAKIYNVRVYDRALGMDEIVTNYISDIKDPIQKDLKIRANKLGEASSDTTLIIPEMTFNMFETDFKNVTKKNKQKATVQYSAADGTVTNIDEFGLVQYQGTSTLAYAVKNYRVTFYDKTYIDKVDSAYPDVADSEKPGIMFNDLKNLGKKKKYDIGNGNKESRFTLKADYMDSSSARNTATAMFIGEMGTELTPPQEYIPSVRTAIYGFPMRLMINKIPDDAIENGLPIEGAGKKESLGIYNFNLDKKAYDSLGFYTKEDILTRIYEDAYDENLDNDLEAQAIVDKFISEYPQYDTLSFEIAANSDTSAGAFADNSYEQIIADFEYRFPDEDDVLSTNFYGDYTKTEDYISLNVTNKFEYAEDGFNINPTDRVSNTIITGTYSKVPGTQDYKSATWTLKYKSDNVYTIDNYLTFEDVEGSKAVTTSVLEIHFIPDPELPDHGHIYFTESDGQAYLNSRIHLKRLIDWVMQSTDDQFHDEFEKHFNLSSVLDYYLLVLANGMVDNLGKNLMLDSYGPAKIGKIFQSGAHRGEVITYTEEEIAKYDNYIWYPHFYDMD